MPLLESEQQPATNSSWSSQARQLCLRLRHSVDSVLHGAYQSRYSGSGLEFAEYRDYQDGDDARQIHWPASLRVGKLLLAKHQEEREVNIVLAVDVSHSMRCEAAKIEQVAMAAGVLAYCAAHSQNPLQLVLFSSQLECHLPARRGERQAQLLVQEILSANPQATGTDLPAMLRMLGNAIHRRSHVALFSDLVDTNFAEELGSLARRHEVIVCHMGQTKHDGLPNRGWIIAEDAETKTQRLISCQAWQEQQRQLQQQHQEIAASVARGAGAEYLLFAPEITPLTVWQRHLLHNR